LQMDYPETLAVVRLPAPCIRQRNRPLSVEPVARPMREIAWEGEVRGRELQEPAPRVDLGHLIGPKAAQEANLAIRGLGPRQSLTGQDASSILCG